jgi:ubiquinone/menaquinone biosynthesis C-methylase UbiE
MNPFSDKERLEREEALRLEFNKWAAEGRGEAMERHHWRITEKTIARMEIEPAHRILEVGCGDAWASRLLASLVPDGAVVGIDVSDEMIRLGREKSGEHENLMLTPGTADDVPWAEDYFDRVLSIESAYYWPSPERAAREIFRVTAYEGRIFVLMNLYEENPYSHHWADKLPIPVSRMATSEWARVFSDAGFTAVETAQIPDDSPIPEDFSGDIHWPTRADRVEFQKIGALLVTGSKPTAPPGLKAAQAGPFSVLN